MIDRRQILLPLRASVFSWTAGASAAACLACPATAFLVLAVAVLACVLITAVFWLTTLLGGILLIGGILGAVVGLFAIQDNPGILVVGIAASVAGHGILQVAPEMNVGVHVFDCMSAPSHTIMEWYRYHQVYLWSWIPFLGVTAFSAITLGTVLTARHMPDRIRAFRRQHCDCPRCHHRGRPNFACPGCGASEPDLRPTIHGLLFAKCGDCQRRMPTLHLSGRHALSRTCANCGVSIEDPNIGRLSVLHVLLLHTDGCSTTKTTLHQLGRRLVYFHQSGIADVASTKSISSDHQYLPHLNLLAIVGSEKLPDELARFFPGLLGVLERATNASTRRGITLPVVVVKQSPRPLIRSNAENSACSARMRHRMPRVSFWQGTFSLEAVLKFGLLDI